MRTLNTKQLRLFLYMRYIIEDVLLFKTWTSVVGLVWRCGGLPQWRVDNLWLWWTRWTHTDKTIWDTVVEKNNSCTTSTDGNYSWLRSGEDLGDSSCKDKVSLQVCDEMWTLGLNSWSFSEQEISPHWIETDTLLVLVLGEGVTQEITPVWADI